MPSLLTLFRSLRAVSLASLVGLALGGCGDDEHGPYPVEPGRERDEAERSVPPGATSRQRLLPPQAPRLVYEAPAKWMEMPPDDMRLASFQVPGENGDGDVSVSRVGGGLAANLNRWRKQMGLPEASPEEIQALPKQRLLGLNAVRVDLRGAYTSMGGGAARPGWRMLGLVAEARTESVFVKFVGPDAVVQANEVAFNTFTDSMRLDSGDGDASPPPSARKPDGFDPATLRWDRPPGWTEVPSTGMFRVADFRIADAPEVEVVLSVPGGDSGGLPLNVNRWRRQMGQKDLSAEEIDGLERFDMLGTKAVALEVPGHYTGMSGEDVPEALFLGVICPRPSGWVFVRLIGPRAGAERNREAFRAYCKSLRIETAK